MTVVADPKWNNSRKAIAFKYKDNDFGYVTHGSLAALEVYKLYDMQPSIARTLSVLDYGCGTGRQARMMSALFKNVVAFDPSPGCLDAFKDEIFQCGRQFDNICITGNADDIPTCDVGYCMHVIEHLDIEPSEILIRNIQSKVRGNVVLAYHAVKNADVLRPYLTTDQIEDDERRYHEENRRIRVRLLDLNKVIQK